MGYFCSKSGEELNDNEKFCDNCVNGRFVMKKIIVFFIVLVVLGFAWCYAWINLGLSQAVSEKTLNISYDEFMYNENIQRLELQMKKSYEGGKFFDRYTEYETKRSNNSIEEKITITVDNSTKEIEQISIHYDIDNNEALLSAQLSASLYATFFASAIDKNITKDSLLMNSRQTVFNYYGLN